MPFIRFVGAAAAFTALGTSVVAISPAAIAAPPKKAASSKAPAKKAAAPQYECQKCHMRVSAAEAKKDKFVDPMDGGKLLLVKPSPKASPSPMKMKM